MTPSVCPSAEDLEQFRLGRSPEADARQLEQHLRGCPACLGRLSAARLDEPLLLGLRAQRGRPRLRNPLLERARQDARDSLRSPAAEERTPHVLAVEPTVDGEQPPVLVTMPPDSLAPCAVPLPGGPYGFLTPARGPGELGWLGSYRILRVLGEGGMGMVLQAEDTRLQRQVALKVMKPLLAADPGARQRFLREARATAALEHEHVIAIHHIDEANGIPYLAMPLLQGETLDERLKRETMLALAEVLRIGRETAEGLAAAHAKGLIHRDVKPSNIWLEAPASRVKILDFGLAAMSVPEGEKTLPGTLLGTPGYMAPEQTEGQADTRSDLFSLGCVLYRMATGQAPFQGQTPLQKIRSTLFEAPKSPQEINPSLPGPLCHLILRLLSPKPQDRPATAVAVARVLETIEGQFARAGMPPLAILVPGNMHLADATIPLAVPTAAVPTPAASSPAAQPPRADGRRLLLGAGVAAVVLLLTLLLARPFRSPSDPGREDRKRVNSGSSTTDRPNAKDPDWPVGEELPPPQEAVRDRRFRESWVTRPEPISGLTSWCIETDVVGQLYPQAFHITNDEQLIIFYSSGWWFRFEPQTCGLKPAPFGGKFDALTRDGQVCARIGSGGVQVWEEGSPIQKRFTLRSPGPSYQAAFTPDGKTIATFDFGTNTPAAFLGFWDVTEGSSLGELRGQPSLQPPIRADFCAWSPDSKTLAVGLYSGEGIALFRSPWKAPAKIIRPASGASILAWSPDAKLLATVGKDGQVYLIDIVLGEVVDRILGTKGTVLRAWEPRLGTSLAVTTADRQVLVWDRKTKKTRRFTGHNRDLTAVAFLGDGRTLVSGSKGSVRFWDLKTGRLRGSLLNLNGPEWLAISPEGHYRGSANAEGRFVLKYLKENIQRELSPADFRKQYGWKNYPERVKLTGD